MLILIRQLILRVQDALRKSLVGISTEIQGESALYIRFIVVVVTKGELTGTDLSEIAYETGIFAFANMACLTHIMCVI